MKGLTRYRKGDWANLEYEYDGLPVKVEGARFLGRGHFTSAFQADGAVILFSLGDTGKECLADRWLDPVNEHVPRLTIVGRMDGPRNSEYDYSVYRMPFYRDITPQDKVAWGQYRILKKLRNEAFRESKRRFNQPPRGWSASFMGVDVNWRLIESARDKLPEDLVAALEQMQNAAANYGSGMIFDDFRKANLGLTDSGLLVLRDVLFDADRAEREFMERYKRRQCRIPVWA